MPQMKPMIWTIMMLMTIIMIMLTIIINFFTNLTLKKSNNKKSIKSPKWEW